MSGCFVLRIDTFLPQGVGRFEVNRDMIPIEDTPEFLRCFRDIGNDDVTDFSSSSLSALSLSFRGFGKFQLETLSRETQSQKCQKWTLRTSFQS